jgi:uncharacterized membrane protein
MTWFGRTLSRLDWRWMCFALCGTAVVHIIATLIPAYYSTNSAYYRLSEGLPANTFLVLPAARPGAQVIPFQQPDTRYAVCRYDTASGPVVLDAVLPAAGWTLSIHSADGSSLYEAPGRAEGATTVSLLLKPPGGYFLGLSVGDQDTPDDHSKVELPHTTGLIVIRGPLGGMAYAHHTEKIISSAVCALRPFGSTTLQ